MKVVLSAALAALALGCSGGGGGKPVPGRDAAPAAGSATSPAGSGGAAAGATTDAGRHLVDRTAETRAVFAAWAGPDPVATLYAAADEKFRTSVSLAELEVFHGDFTARAGAFVELVAAEAVEMPDKDGVMETFVHGEVRFVAGLAPYELFLRSDGTTHRLLKLNLQLPPALKTPPDRALARSRGRAAADKILAVALDGPDGLDAMSLPRIRAQRSAEDLTRLRGLVASVGGGARLEVVRDEECGGIQHCLVYHAVGKRGGATIKVTLSAPLGRWWVNDWNFELDAPAPPPAPAGP